MKPEIHKGETENQAFFSFISLCMEHLFYLSGRKNTYLLHVTPFFMGLKSEPCIFVVVVMYEANNAAIRIILLVGLLSYSLLCRVVESNSSGRLTSTLTGHSPVWHMLLASFLQIKQQDSAGGSQ